MGFLKNHLSGEDTPQARRPGTLAGEAQQARTPRPHRGLPAGAAAADRADVVASHRLKHHLNRYPVPEWMHQQVYLHPYPKELMPRNHV
jgi:hypothetical protein